MSQSGLNIRTNFDLFSVCLLRAQNVEWNLRAVGQYIIKVHAVHVRKEKNEAGLRSRVMTSQPAVVPPVWAARYKKEAHPQHRRWIKSHTAPVTRSNAGVGGAGTSSSRRQIPAKIWGNNCETVVTVSAAVEDGLEEQWRIVYDPDGAEKDRERGGLVLRCVLFFVFCFFLFTNILCFVLYTRVHYYQSSTAISFQSVTAVACVPTSAHKECTHRFFVAYTSSPRFPTETGR